MTNVISNKRTLKDIKKDVLKMIKSPNKKQRSYLADALRVSAEKKSA